ncbi:patatin-like phospholipase family protein [Lachnoclostridium phytofermentans]|uniref:Patatin n=1 Tax=Lachnoclostridium phytofermentans (strain ATCC 700394 / DSM 18823 / ISDg) TaxID=357809 RepID=A9KHE0_LACP7|nr:patatin-like phospholipase family protein [Lachnoclostridium phytofermentans]ABX40807.1 Patatin [Lachnoclostridium phytofermentans ISDg]
MEGFDFSKEYGIVLEGGGAKGAYQIGVWKAMRELGIKIKGISGVSVGALNGALICMGDFDKAIKLWESITYDRVMEVDNEQMEHLIKRELKQLKLVDLTKTGMRVLASRGFKVAPLKSMIEEVVDENKIRESNIEFYLGTFCISDMKQLEICAAEAEPEKLKDYLLASAYFPAFKNEKLHGLSYVDGGVMNNVPIDTLIKNGYKDIIVVRIYGIGVEKRVKIPEDVRVTTVAPRVDLGSILEFDGKKTQRNITIGYFDAMRVFKFLKGKIYYVDAMLNERDCLELFLECHPSVTMAYHEYYKLDYSNEALYTRDMLETILPLIAEELKLAKDWSYFDLYLALLELCAKYMHVQKYYIYTEQELVNKIKIKYELRKKRHDSKEIPPFVQLALGFITIQ